MGSIGWTQYDQKLCRIYRVRLGDDPPHITPSQNPESWKALMEQADRVDLECTVDTLLTTCQRSQNENADLRDENKTLRRQRYGLALSCLALLAFIAGQWS